MWKTRIFSIFPTYEEKYTKKIKVEEKKIFYKAINPYFFFLIKQ